MFGDETLGVREEGRDEGRKVLIDGIKHNLSVLGKIDLFSRLRCMDSAVLFNNAVQLGGLHSPLPPACSVKLSTSQEEAICEQDDCIFCSLLVSLSVCFRWRPSE